MGILGDNASDKMKRDGVVLKMYFNFENAHEKALL